MLILDSDTSQSKTFRQISRDRLLYEMLQDSKSADSKSSWKVLILDKVTLKVMSHSCKMADITVQGVSLVEDLFRRREPMPSMDVIYFIQPTKENIVMFLSDMSGREPLYRKAYIYFSSKVSKDLITRIKNDISVLPRIGALREMNLEYFSIDHQGFVTDQENALQELFGDNASNSRRFDTCLNEMATRIATVFASLKEFPSVHYKVFKGLDDDTTEMTHHDLIPSKLAAAVWDRITTYRSSIPNFPQTETCELLIVDRSVDQIAPVIQEWTYDAMCHDLLELDGNKYVHEVPSKSGGEQERKEVLLEEHDPIWLELRHAHFAEASERLHDKMVKFVSQNKAAQLRRRNSDEFSMRNPLKIVQALPQCNEQMEKLSLHVQIARKLNQIIRDSGLYELGQLEQDLVHGDAGAKEVINYLIANQETSSENKLRLLMIYACVYPDKFEGDNGIKLMQLAKLSQADMKAVENMNMLKGSLPKKTTSHAGFLHKFDSTKKRPEWKERTGEEEKWALFRFHPKIEELIEKLSKGELPSDEYHCMNKPSSSSRATYGSSDDEASRGSVLTSASAGLKGMGQRIFVFIIGGATRSELKVCHKLTAKLRREIILGTTSLDDPPQYITKLKLLSEKELSVEDIKL